jgi:hypothetical protein
VIENQEVDTPLTNRPVDAKQGIMSMTWSRDLIPDFISLNSLPNFLIKLKVKSIFLGFSII